jgi:hypothetical protein
MGVHSASRPTPRPPVYDEDFAKRAREATQKALDSKGKGR